jgi:fructokinase
VRLISIGEILWDVIGPNEHLGGAPLNFAAHARTLGHEVFLVSAVGDDERGRRALAALKTRGISTELVQVLPGRNTGTAEIELDWEGKPAFHIMRPAAYDFVDLAAPMRERIRNLQADWIYFGTLYHTSRQALPATLRLLEEMPAVKRFYDVNLRDGNWTLATVEQLAERANVIKLSASEAEFLDGSFNADGMEGTVEHFCRRWSDQYRCQTVCLTMGERGCGIYRNGTYAEVPGYKVQVADTVGAGDAFAAAFLHALSQRWEMKRCGRFANATGALVASRSGAIPEWKEEEVAAMLRRRDGKL